MRVEVAPAGAGGAEAPHPAPMVAVRPPIEPRKRRASIFSSYKERRRRKSRVDVPAVATAFLQDPRGSSGAGDGSGSSPAGGSPRVLPTLRAKPSAVSPEQETIEAVRRMAFGRMDTRNDQRVSASAGHGRSLRLFASKSRFDFILVMATCVECISVPIRAGFEADEQSWMQYFDVSTDCIFWLDIVFNAFSPKWVDGVLVTDLPGILRDYCNWRHPSLFLDVLASFPFDYIWGSTVHWRAVLRLNRLLRLIKLVNVFRELEERTETTSNALALFKSGLALMFLVHLIGCAWFGISYFEDFPDNSWAPTEAMRALPLDQQYMLALLWAFNGIYHPAYVGTDFTPATRLEFVFSLMVMLLGIFMFASIVGFTSTIILNWDASASRYREKTAQLQQYCATHHVSPELKTRLIGYYKYMWSRHKGFDQKDVLVDLPEYLRRKLALEVNSEILCKVPLFQGFSQSFISALATKLEPMVCTPGDYVVNAGDLGAEMYFISKGELEVHPPNSTQRITLAQGSYFGEIALLFAKKRTADVVAVDYCDLYKLSKADLEVVLDEFPVYREVLSKIAALRYEVTASTKNSTHASAEARAAGSQRVEGTRRKSVRELDAMFDTSELSQSRQIDYQYPAPGSSDDGGDADRDRLGSHHSAPGSRTSSVSSAGDAPSDLLVRRGAQLSPVAASPRAGSSASNTPDFRPPPGSAAAAAAAAAASAAVVAAPPVHDWRAAAAAARPRSPDSPLRRRITLNDKTLLRATLNARMAMKRAESQGDEPAGGPLTVTVPPPFVPLAAAARSRRRTTDGGPNARTASLNSKRRRDSGSGAGAAAAKKPPKLRALELPESDPLHPSRLSFELSPRTLAKLRSLRAAEVAASPSGARRRSYNDDDKTPKLKDGVEVVGDAGDIPSVAGEAGAGAGAGAAAGASAASAAEEEEEVGEEEEKKEMEEEEAETEEKTEEKEDDRQQQLLRRGQSSTHVRAGGERPVLATSHSSALTKQDSQVTEGSTLSRSSTMRTGSLDDAVSLQLLHEQMAVLTTTVAQLADVVNQSMADRAHSRAAAAAAAAAASAHAVADLPPGTSPRIRLRRAV